MSDGEGILICMQVNLQPLSTAQKKSEHLGHREHTAGLYILSNDSNKYCANEDDNYQRQNNVKITVLNLRRVKDNTR